MKPSRGCSVITRHACTQPWAMSAPSSLNSSGIERRKQSQADQAATANTGYGKAGKQSALSNFPTATTITNYNQYGIRILRARSQGALLPPSQKALQVKGKSFSIFMPLVIGGDEKNYLFTVLIKDVEI